MDRESGILPCVYRGLMGYSYITPIAITHSIFAFHCHLSVSSSLLFFPDNGALETLKCRYI